MRPVFLVALAATAAAAWYASTLPPDASDVIAAASVERRPRPATLGAPVHLPAPVGGRAGVPAAAPPPSGVETGAGEDGGPRPAVAWREPVPAARDLFPVMRPPAPRVRAEAVAPPPPPPRPAPSLSLIGRMVEDGTAVAIVRDGERVLTLKSGDSAQGYRVETIGEQTVVLAHLRDGQRHTLRFAAAAPGGAGRFRPAGAR